MDRSQIFNEMLEDYHKLKFNPATGEVDTKQIGTDGKEYLDDTPIAPPVGYKRQPSLAEQIRLMVRNERLAAELAAQGIETFEESEDFDIGDDFDPTTPWENDFDPPLRDIQQSVEEHRAAQPPASTENPAPGGAPPARSQEPAPAPNPAPPNPA